MLLNIQGDEATAKSTIAYTAPKPIVGFDFDMGAERALFGSANSKFFKGLDISIVPYSGQKPEVSWSGHDITIYELPQPVQLLMTKVVGATELWEYYAYLFAKAIEDVENVTSVVVDTMTLLRKIRADAHLQQLQKAEKSSDRSKLLQIEWGPANDSVRNSFSLAKNLRRHLIGVHHLKDERTDKVQPSGQVEKGVLTGKRILDGEKNVPRYVDFSLETSRTKNNELIAEVIKCGYNPSLTGSIIENPCWDEIDKLVKAAGYGREL